MAGGIAPNAQSQFTFYASAANYGSLGNANIIARVQIPTSALCIAENRTCSRNATTGADTLAISVIAPQPDFAINSTNDSLCVGNAEVFTINTSVPLTGYTFTWLVDGQIKQQGAQDNFSYAVAVGNHIISVSATANGGCALGASTTIKGLEVPNLIVVDAVTATSCIGSSDGTVTCWP